MSRIATFTLQRTVSAAIQRQQQALAKTELQLATEKKASDYASLGPEAVRNLSTHSLLAQQEAYVDASKQADLTLTLNDANIGAIDTSASSLRKDLITAIGINQSAGLNEAISAAFNEFRAALNASEGGSVLFGGSQIDGPPFLPNTLADTIGVPASAAFANDGIKSSVRLSNGVDIQYGVTASDIGSGLYTAFQTLAAAGPIGNPPTAAQIAALNTAVAQIDTGLTSLRTVNAENGRKQAQVDTLGTRATERGNLLKGIISGNEDADLGQLAFDLVQRQTFLKASYSVFSQLSELSLVNYLR